VIGKESVMFLQINVSNTLNDTEISQVTIPEKVADLLQHLFREMKSCKNLDILLSLIQKFIEDSLANGINLITKVIQQIMSKFNEFSNQMES
jgi:hypothetical protein